MAAEDAVKEGVDATKNAIGGAFGSAAKFVGNRFVPWRWSGLPATVFVGAACVSTAWLVMPAYMTANTAGISLAASNGFGGNIMALGGAALDQTLATGGAFMTGGGEILTNTDFGAVADLTGNYFSDMGSAMAGDPLTQVNSPLVDPGNPLPFPTGGSEAAAQLSPNLAA